MKTETDTLTLPDVSSKYGAPMGRQNEIPPDYNGEPLNLTQLPFQDGDYDQGGAYWGSPDNVWCAWRDAEDSETVRVYVRATSICEAMQAVRESMPLATFNGEQATLDSFMRAYLVCALWSTNDESTPAGGEPMDRNYSIADIAPDALASMQADCAKFQEVHGSTLRLAYETGDGYDSSNAGHDFWLTRNGHGAGFWDRKALEPDSDEYEELTQAMIAARDDNEAWNKACMKRSALKTQSIRQKLTEAAKAFGECNLYVGDDGKLYV